MTEAAELRRGRGFPRPAVSQDDQTFSARDAMFALALFGLSLTLRATVVLAFDVPPTWDGEFYHPLLTGYRASMDHGLQLTLRRTRNPGRLPVSTRRSTCRTRMASA